MNTMVDRRASHLPNAIVSQPDTTHTVQHGIFIQTYLGTRAAVEYLKMSKVPGIVIQRVLSGESVRIADTLLVGEALAR
jgi:hypothetical protein